MDRVRAPATCAGLVGTADQRRWPPWVKNPHTVADDHGEPEELLASLTAAEAETAKLRGQLKAILAEALAQ